VGANVGAGDGSTLEGAMVGVLVDELHDPGLVITTYVADCPCSNPMAADSEMKDDRKTPVPALAPVPASCWATNLDEVQKDDEEEMMFMVTVTADVKTVDGLAVGIAVGMPLLLGATVGTFVAVGCRVLNVG